MDSSIKSLTITGTAAEDAMKPRRSGRSGSRRKRQDIPETDEYDEPMENAKRIVFGQKVEPRLQPPKAIIQMPSVQIPKAIQPARVQVPSIQPPKLQVPSVQPPRFEEPKSEEQEGGSVILRPPKNPRIKLQPKVQHTSAVVNQTRKARRIHLVNLTHRFTRAKRVHDDTSKKAIDSIREYLIQKGVIQMKSKAPEKMLRSMYSDFMLLKDQAL